jgi:hypothetical protein
MFLEQIITKAGLLNKSSSLVVAMRVTRLQTIIAIDFVAICFAA